MSWNLRLAAAIWRTGGRRLRNRFRLKRLEPARGSLQLEYLEERTLLSGAISGQVFEDFNSNGVFDSGRVVHILFEARGLFVDPLPDGRGAVAI